MGKVFQALIVFCFIIFLFGEAEAIQTFQQNQDIDIKHPVRIDGAIAPDALCNITVYYPNNSILINFQEMGNTTSYHNYTLSSTQTGTKGIYNYDVTCKKLSYNKTSSFQFLINLGGVEPSQQRTDTTTRTIWIFVILGIFTFIGMLMSKKVPLKATLFLVMIWFILMAVSFSFTSLQDEVVNKSLEDFFSFFLVLTHYANYFIFISIMIIWLFTFFFNMASNSKSKKREKYAIE